MKHAERIESSLFAPASIRAANIRAANIKPANIKPANIKPANIKHGFFGIGASERASASSDVELDACAKLSLLSRELGSGFSHFMCVRQFHSNRVISLTTRVPSRVTGGAKPRASLWSKHASAPQGDGIVTNLPGVLLGVYTADCAPILLADCSADSSADSSADCSADSVGSNSGKNSAITSCKSCGVAHAGWRGALSGVIESAVAGMLALGTRVEDIKVAIGPTISALSYPVSDDFLPAILEHEIPLTRDNMVFFQRYSAQDHSEAHSEDHSEAHSDSWYFDLGEYVCARLRGCGISDDRIDRLRVDTFSDEDYYSHRRFVGTGAGAGRNFSCIGFV